MSTQNNNQNNDWTSWIPIVVLFCIPYTWPVALFLLFRKLTGSGGKKRQARHPYDIQKEWQEQQRPPAEYGAAEHRTAGPTGRAGSTA